MGHPDGAHTHGSGGSGLGTALLVLVGAALAVKLAGPVAAAVGRARQHPPGRGGHRGGRGGYLPAVLLRVAPVPVAPPRRVPRHSLAPGVARAAQSIPRPQRLAIERSGELHLHLHGVTAEDVAAILARDRLPGNPP
jgi:hypothetical protein